MDWLIHLFIFYQKSANGHEFAPPFYKKLFTTFTFTKKTQTFEQNRRFSYWRIESVIIQLQITTGYYKTVWSRGGAHMLENVIEFFKNLPDKVCVKCGEKIEEQSECYCNTCDKCSSL